MKLVIVGQLCLAFGYCGPIISPSGVVNAASYAMVGLPNSGIAQGSIFLIFGKNLGPDVLKQAPYPLASELAQTSVEITVGGITVTPYILYTSSNQIGAILPSSTPIGEARLTVFYGGETSPPITFKVVRSAVGIFTLSQSGGGAAVLQNVGSTGELGVNTLTESAKPGSVGILYATGLGPVDFDERTFPQAKPLDVKVDVQVGGKRSKILYAGRSPCCAGLDQINFEIPSDTPEGCFVPIVVNADNILSNFTSISISSTSHFCFDQVNLSPADVQVSGPRYAVISLGLLSFGDDTFSINLPLVQATFYIFNIEAYLKSYGLSQALPPFGTCTVSATVPGSVSFDLYPLRWLDAGPSVDLVGATTKLSLIPMQKGVYTPPLAASPDTAILNPGTIIASGPGGVDVGPFKTNLQMPSLLNWSNKQDLHTVNRSRDLLITWTGGNSATGYVKITGTNTYSTPPRVKISFTCTARVSAGRFSVPSEILSLLPADLSLSDGNGSIEISSSGFGQALSIPGIDVAAFLYLFSNLKTVTFQ